MAGEIYIADKATLDKVNLNVGSNSDVGSVHAKLKDLKKYVASKRPMFTNFKTLNPMYSGDQYSILNILGKGNLESITTARDSNGTAKIKIIVDGTVLTDLYLYEFLGLSSNDITSSPTSSCIFLNLQFNTSLKIELYVVSGSATTYTRNINICYSLV